MKPAFRPADELQTPIHDFLDYRSQQRSFSSIAAFCSGTVNLSGADKAERYDGASASADLFDVLQVRRIVMQATARSSARPFARTASHTP